MIRELRQSLGSANADTAWNAHPIEDAATHAVPIGDLVARHAAEVDETLVDWVDFLAWAKARSQTRHAVWEVAI